MNSLSALLLPVALLASAAPDRAGGGDEAAHHSTSPAAAPKLGFERQVPAPLRKLRDSIEPQVQAQVRIEQRVIIRISPSPPAAREAMLSRLPRRDMPTRYKEQKLDGCVAIEGIAGVAPMQENRLLLFMRDHRVLSAALDRACDAEAFYSGFYVERSADGMLCSRRDKLQSRAGASCELTQINRLVAIRD